MADLVARTNDFRRHAALAGAGRRPAAVDRTVCVAPMMNCTDRHARYLLRLVSRRALLYTEMIPCGALLHGDRRRFLAFDPGEHPLAAQLGGSDPAQMARAARLVEQAGYDEVNMNVGCPSPRVTSGRFGACLMAEPELVADCVRAMGEAVTIPVTVKTRLGIDDRDSFDELCRFVETVAAAGCGTFVVHARKAWLKGLSPRQNRDVPPLDYPRVHRLKQRFAHLEIVVNGGIRTLDEAAAQLGPSDGVMIGRAAYENPYLLASVDARFFADSTPARSRREVLEAYLHYVERELLQGVWLRHMARPLLGLYQGFPGAKRWRRHLVEAGSRPGAGADVVRRAHRLLVESADRRLRHPATVVKPPGGHYEAQLL